MDMPATIAELKAELLTAKEMLAREAENGKALPALHARIAELEKELAAAKAAPPPAKKEKEEAVEEDDDDTPFLVL